MKMIHSDATAWQHWQLTRDGEGLAWLSLDKAGESTNSLSAAVLAELSGVLDELDRHPPRGLILRSAKAAGFIAGADIGEFDALADIAAARAMVTRGWELCNRLAAVPYPTLALVRGHCLGGGLELALACRTLVVVDELGTKLGLPEVMLGIFPGWGGMARLPRRVGPGPALDLMLTGKTVDAKKAKRLGLADACVPPRVMEAAARSLALTPPRHQPLPLLQRLFLGPLRPVVARQARQQVAKRARPEHYPAPYAIIDLWAKHDGNPLGAPEILESIVASPTTANLLRVFRLQERLKAFGKGRDFAPARVHVVGAGVMGGDIAAWCAARGFTVTLQDQTVARIAPAIQRAYRSLSKRLKDKLQLRNVMDRLIPDPEGHGAAHADVVIEAIFENLGAKQRLLLDLEVRMKPEAVLATNTSSLCLEDLSQVLQRPERLVGLHFFNPVARMPLVEVVSAAGGDPAMARKACAFVGRIDKLPLPVKSAPGFLVNAVLGPYLLEAMACVDEGLTPETVDEAALAFGMPMGPLELADTVGLDIAMATGQALTRQGAEPPQCLTRLFQQGHLGRKTGQGFYPYPGGKVRKGAAGLVPAGLGERLLAPLIARTAQLVADGVVADQDLADGGVIFGTGFAPFRGGPLHYARSRNV